MKSEINVEAKDGVLEIREGAALPLKEPRVVSLSGIITTPADWVKKRNTGSNKTFPELKANVVANYTNRTITLTINEDSHYATTVIGKLEVYPELATLGINKEKEYGEKDLFQAIKFLGRFFEDREDYSKLMSSLQKFRAQVKIKFVNEDDFQGKSAVEKLTEIEHDIPLKFKLKMPLFCGLPAHEFEVIICVGIRKGMVMWLESVPMHEAMESTTISIFETQLGELANYAIVRQY